MNQAGNFLTYVPSFSTLPGERVNNEVDVKELLLDTAASWRGLSETLSPLPGAAQHTT
jgi:hypothetical protein